MDFREVERRDGQVSPHVHIIPAESWRLINLCRGLKTDLRQLWPELKSFN